MDFGCYILSSHTFNQLASILDEDSLDPNGHICQMGRREAVSKWLCETAEKHIQQEVAHSAYQVKKLTPISQVVQKTTDTL